MKTDWGTLGYCSNIHPGEKWDEHFSELKDKLPQIKAKISPEKAFGFGLRIANEASLELEDMEKLSAFKDWLKKEDLYVFTLNGFPYGGFHHVRVKEDVHSPDWRTLDRVNYTKRLINHLAYLIPDDLMEAGISTSPLSYKPWFNNPIELLAATIECTNHLMEVVMYSKIVFEKTGKKIHIDIEPEPDGILGDHHDFIDWYENILLVHGKNYLISKGFLKEQVEETIRNYVRICFDVCHYGVNFDSPTKSLDEFKEKGIKMGKYQISSAIKILFNKNDGSEKKSLEPYVDPVYLHQVKALKRDGSFQNYLDLNLALNEDSPASLEKEWRIHFHVPIFMENYENISSTQAEILETLDYIKYHQEMPIMEIETYTWSILPKEIQTNIVNSISREINWVIEQLKK
ncbi:MAG: hypothetical protein RIR51_465 [Bacteroidota bacterium]|jgi:hypothetical protein